MAAEMVGEGQTLSAAEDLTVEEALRQVRALCIAGPKYMFSFMDDDGQLLRRFGRTQHLEAWVCATPVTDDGKRDRSQRMIVCPIAVPACATPEERVEREAELRAELERLLADGS